MQEELSPLTSFKDQFLFTPTIETRTTLQKFPTVIICGMGGSAICVSLLQLLFPDLTIRLHNSYGLPKKYDKSTTLFIFNSYSGNTEETLDSLERAVREGVNAAALSRGGLLIKAAKEASLPYILLPESSLEPRFSIGHQMIGLLTLMSEHEKIEALRGRIELLSLSKLEEQGKLLAEKCKGKYPVLYSSSEFYPVAYLIKAAINEGAKIPAFTNQIPEANHNELQSFVTNESMNESAAFAFIYISSSYDHVRIIKRMTIMKELADENNFITETLHGDHTDILSVFEIMLTGYFMATFLALDKNINPYTTPLIAEFKKRMAQ